ncbi:tryptophan halogenase family protein [Parvularcula marina]|uniref:Tryptophan 7-halogenase n=1 Tax=Parvularcula marina TaxID=2292771 RepID=A0A371RHK9_9PROT|nr:tryptophan halogenase family protein [Parvularcula marina]RFB04931.1 tryptophan 7-halogenase [Parvularcula marina]
MTGAIREIVIVGGGTAGWLTAGILAADHRAASSDGLRVTLIESPDIPTLGVGEGTWPSLRDTLRRIGISETDFLRHCDASFKQGSRFDGWVNGKTDDIYYHPFDAPPPTDDIDPLALASAAPAGTPFAEAVSTQAILCQMGRAPKQAMTPEYAAVANYAYHLDAPAFAAMLREHCQTRLGVTLIIDTVDGIERDETGNISSLQAREHGNITGDLFVDCTGGRALLIGEAMRAELTDVSDLLFNDRALAIQIPNGESNSQIASQTTATAMPSGWVWDIALQSRRGIGHVFSSSHQDEETARNQLSDYIARTAPWSDLNGGDARLIKFRSAYRKTPWVGNVVAIGMSQGFVEPLEASAIVMIELSATMLSDTLPPRRELLEGSARRFNDRFSYRWERIVEFLKLHYVLSERPEPYWAAHRDPANSTGRLNDLLDRWRFEVPSREDFPQAQEIFPATSFIYILYGMGKYPADRPLRRRKDDKERAERFFAEIVTKTRKFAEGLPSNRELLDHLKSHGFPRI